MTIVLYLLAFIIVLHSSLAVFGLAKLSFRRNFFTILAESATVIVAITAAAGNRWGLMAFGIAFHKLWIVGELLRNSRSLRQLIPLNLCMALACLIAWISEIWLLLPLSYGLYRLATFVLLRRHTLLGLHSRKARA